MSISSSDRRLCAALPWAASGALALFAAACTPDACLRESDCAPGFTCTAAACVRDAVDAGPVDGGPSDAASVDAGPRDASAADAGSTDAASAVDAGG